MMAPAHGDAAASSPWRHLPNVVSLLRIALVVPVALAIEARCFRLGLGLGVVAGLSDALDGWLARRFDWRSRLGSVLDPMADKLLIFGTFVSLTSVGKIPLALTVLVLGRDIVIAVGALAWQRVIGGFRARPSVLSKGCTLVQLVYVLVILTMAAGWWSMPHAPWIWVVVVATLVSGLDYIVRWGLAARRELAARGARSKP